MGGSVRRMDGDSGGFLGGVEVPGWVQREREGGLRRNVSVS